MSNQMHTDLTAEPTPPRNVRAVMPDGREIPLECRYVGTEEGIHVWEAVYALPEPMASLRVDMLPGQTEVRLSAQWKIVDHPAPGDLEPAGFHSRQPQDPGPIIYIRPLPLSSNAVIALVAGIVGAVTAPCAWIVPVASLLAPIAAVSCGHQALKGLRAQPDTMRGQGLATAGLWLGYGVGIPMALWNIGLGVSLFMDAWKR